MLLPPRNLCTPELTCRFPHRIAKQILCCTIHNQQTKWCQSQETTVIVKQNKNASQQFIQFKIDLYTKDYSIKSKNYHIPIVC